MKEKILPALVLGLTLMFPPWFYYDHAGSFHRDEFHGFAPIWAPPVAPEYCRDVRDAEVPNEEIMSCHYRIHWPVLTLEWMLLALAWRIVTRIKKREAAS